MVRTASFTLFTVLIASGCTKAPRADSARTLVLLTRDGCAMSSVLKSNLDLALDSLKTTLSYQVIDEATLPSTDPRSSYPTPTILYRDRDLFGLPEPTPPFPQPT